MEMLSKSLRARIRKTRGMEFSFKFSANNGEDLYGLSTMVYVAYADPDVGITIMGQLPEGINPEEYGAKAGQDIVIQCCDCGGDPNHPDYIRIMKEYVNMIESGGMFRLDQGHISGGRADYMASMCPFG